ncbi:MAG: AMP-binding protein [Candidatus Geothermincolia bacterium]
MEKRWLSSYDPDVPESIEYPIVPVHQPMLDSARLFPNVPAIIDRGCPITYSELASQVGAFSRALARVGVSRGSRVGIFLPNVPEMVVSYYSTLATGAAAVLLSPRLVAREFEQMVSDAGFDVLVCFDEFLPTVKEMRGGTGIETVIVVRTEGMSAVHGEGTFAFDKMIGDGGPAYDPPDIDPVEDVAVMIYTGGTTGLPKAVMLTHYAVVANAMQLGAWVGLHEGYPAIAALPLFHSYGMSTGMNAALFHGASSVLVRGEGAGEIVDSIARDKVRLLVGVPSTIEGIVNHPGIEEADLSSLEYCFVGAAPLPRGIRKRFNSITPARLLEGYGLTEAVTAQSANPRGGQSKPGSIGLPFPDVEFKIVDLETGSRDLLPEKAGELVIKSPCLMKGYHNRPADTAKALRNGWLFTGDVAWMDYEGYFFVIDRKKDMITTGVFKAYPAEVESVINAHELVRESAVVGLFDDFRGHSLKAFIVLEPGARMTEQEMLDYLRGNLSPHKVPRVIDFRDELPKSDVGKILRSELE